MTDIYSIFGTLLAVGIVFPGMLFTWRLLFPKATDRAAFRFKTSPWKSMWVGVGTALLVGIPIFILYAIQLPFSAVLATFLLFFTFGIAAIGASGVVLHMAQRIQKQNHEINNLKAFLGAALAFEFAAAFPLVGWFIFIPLVLMISLGTAVFSLRNRNKLGKAGEILNPAEQG